MDIDGIFYCSHCMRRLDEKGLCPFCGYDASKVRHDPTILEEGTLLNDRYQLGASIGRGGFGITYAAWDETLQVAVAVKEYFPLDIAERSIDISDEVHPLEEFKVEFQVGRDRFIRESKVLAMLHEIPGIVQVLDCFEENGTCYIAMEYIHGVPLDEYVRKNDLRDGKILELMHRPIEALIAMHRLGVLHRDISPDNIMVSEDGTVKLIDFGAAVQMERRKGGQDHTVVLKRRYAALEQHDTSLEQGPWTDVYDMSATLYKLLTGDAAPEAVRRVRFDEIVPLNRTSARLKRHEQRAIMGGLQVLPEKRIRSMGEFRSILFDIPFPDEVVRRRRIQQALTSLVVFLVAVAALVAANFTVGLPFGDGLMYSLTGDGAHVVNSMGLKGDVSVRDNVFGMPVTAIDKGVFSRDTDIVSITLPGSIERIENAAFQGCTQLQTVIIGDGLKYIGDNAFLDCASLMTVHMPDSIEEISGSAFGAVPQHMTIWCSSDSKAGSYAGEYGYGSCDYDDFSYVEKDGSITLTGYNGSKLDIHMPSVINGMNVTEIAPEAAAGMFPMDIQTVELPKHLKTIPDNMFSGCTALREAVFGSYLTHIGSGAFRGTALSSVQLPDTVVSIGDYAFEGAEALASVSLGRSLETIGEYAFAYTCVTRVELPELLKTIGSNAFCSSGLTSLKLPAYLESIGEYAFAYCPVTDVTFMGTPSFQTVSIDNGIFFGCDKLERVTLAKNVKDMPNHMFENCGMLHDISMTDAVINIGDGCFRNCSSLEYIVLPDSVRTLGDGAFAYCVRMRTVYMPESITELGSYVFDGCYSGLTIVGEGDNARMNADALGFEYDDMNGWAVCAFDEYGALRLEDYRRKGAQQEGVAHDEQLPFKDSIKLPAFVMTEEGGATPVTVLGAMSGLNCREITLPAHLERIASYSISDDCSAEIIKIPKVKYISDAAFSRLKSLKSIELPEGLISIGESAFACCDNLNGITLPDSLESIGDSAFYGCRSLTEINLTGKLTFLPNGCFEMTGLRSIEIPGSVTTCHTAFAYCEELEFAKFGEGCRVVMGTFYGCTALETVVFPATLDKIGIETFANCAALKNIWVLGMDTDLDSRETIEFARIEMEHLLSDSPDVVIHGYAGSRAQEFAEQYGVPFEIITSEYEIPTGGAY